MGFTGRSHITEVIKGADTEQDDIIQRIMELKAGKRAQAEKERADEARKAYQKKSAGGKGGEGRGSNHTSGRPVEGDGNHPDSHPVHVETLEDDDEEAN